LLVTSGDVLCAHPLYPAMLVLVLAGAFTKSAHVPFYAAPAPPGT
jgi:multicomponent K+:H+ antiporter subunit A